MRDKAGRDSASFPPRHWPMSKRWGTRAIHRASSGLYFILENLLLIHKGGTDPAYSRSLYTLLAINCELILSAYLLLKRDDLIETKDTLKSELRGKKNHDLSELAKKIGAKNLQEIGIKTIKPNSEYGFKRYTISFVQGGTLTIDDIVTVRYDYQSDHLRPLDSEESSKMTDGVNILLKITEDVMKLIPTS